MSSSSPQQPLRSYRAAGARLHPLRTPAPARQERALRELAFHDPLTRLPNRRLLLDRMDHALRACRRQSSHAALVFLDLDNFKRLNDLHGHDAGDQ